MDEQQAGVGVSVIASGQGRTFRVFDDLLTFSLTSEQTGGAFSLIFDRLLPGGSVPTHSQKGMETFIVLEGQVEFVLQEEKGGALVTYTAGPGSVIHVPQFLGHGYRNPTSAPAALFVIFTPGEGAERFFEKIGVSVPDPKAPPPFTFPEPDVLQQLMREYGIRHVAPPKGQ